MNVAYYYTFQSCLLLLDFFLHNTIISSVAFCFLVLLRHAIVFQEWSSQLRFKFNNIIVWSDPTELILVTYLFCLHSTIVRASNTRQQKATKK